MSATNSEAESLMLVSSAVGGRLLLHSLLFDSNDKFSYLSLVRKVSSLFTLCLMGFGFGEKDDGIPYKGFSSIIMLEEQRC
jgi:hypothetical protein